jgi:hypothetical protein
MSYELTEKKLKKFNKILLKDLHESLSIDKTILSNNDLLQKISQALFSKSFEEIQKTIFTDNEIELNSEIDTTILNHSSAQKVIVLSYGAEKLLMINGELESATHIYVGDEDEKTFKEILKEAEYEALERDCLPFKEVTIPEILGDEWDYDDIIELANKMGYFKYENTLFDLIESPNYIFINDQHSPFGLDNNWVKEIVSEHVCNYDIGNSTIWHIEIFSDNSDDFNEYYFTFNDICNATLNKNKTWSINEYNKKENIINIVFKLN